MTLPAVAADRLRIVLGAISLEAGNGGIARVARLVARVLAEEQQTQLKKVDVLDFADRASPPDLGLPISLSGGSKLRFYFQAFRAAQASRYFIHDGCHLSQVHRLPGLRHKPFMTFLCGIEVWEKAKPSYIRSARQARVLIAISEYTLRRTERLHGPLPQARVCWLATEADDAPAEKLSVSGPPEVLIVGRLETEEQKGHRPLIESWAKVAEAVPDAILRIVGRGPALRSLQELAGRSRAARQIVFAGFVPDPELEETYRRAAIFCMPSRQEGFGLVYIEAMRHGLPVVASIHDAAPEVVIDAKTGYTVNLDHPGELAERLIHLLKNPDDARQLGREGQTRWAEHFRYSAFRERFRPILRAFLNSD